MFYKINEENRYYFLFKRDGLIYLRDENWLIFSIQEKFINAWVKNGLWKMKMCYDDVEQWRFDDGDDVYDDVHGCKITELIKKSKPFFAIEQVIDDTQMLTEKVKGLKNQVDTLAYSLYNKETR